MLGLRLPDVDQWSERVVVALGQNPGAFTGPGTNTYLVGTGRERVLLDTGQGLPAYLPVLERALEAAGGARIRGTVPAHRPRNHLSRPWSPHRRRRGEAARVHRPSTRARAADPRRARGRARARPRDGPPHLRRLPRGAARGRRKLRRLAPRQAPARGARRPGRERGSAAGALAALALTHPILARLRDRDPAERRDACLAAALDPAAVLLAPGLAQALGDPVRAVWRAASEALVAVAARDGAGVLAALRAALHGGDPR